MSADAITTEAPVAAAEQAESTIRVAAPEARETIVAPAVRARSSHSFGARGVAATVAMAGLAAFGSFTPGDRAAAATGTTKKVTPTTKVSDTTVAGSDTTVAAGSDTVPTGDTTPPADTAVPITQVTPAIALDTLAKLEDAETRYTNRNFLDSRYSRLETMSVAARDAATKKAITAIRSSAKSLTAAQTQTRKDFFMLADTAYNQTNPAAPNETKGNVFAIPVGPYLQAVGTRIGTTPDSTVAIVPVCVQNPWISKVGRIPDRAGRDKAEIQSFLAALKPTAAMVSVGIVNGQARILSFSAAQPRHACEVAASGDLVVKES